MKKITAFFMALMPLLVTILLFAAGLIVKNSTHVYVQSVELPQQSVPIKVEDTTKEKTYQMEVNVLPHNATNPKVKWTTSDVDGKILTINNDGVITCKDYGEAYVYATSEENPTLASAAKVDIFDTKIHEINVDNQYDVSYVGIDETKKINVTTKPTMSHIQNQSLNFDLDDESKKIINITKDGTILPIKEGKANVRILSNDNESKAFFDLPVKIGKGVSVLSLKNPAKETTSSKNYNLFEQIETAPEPIRTQSVFDENASNIIDTDFIYTSSDENTAIVDKHGNVSFIYPGTVTFTISYKRKPELKITKTIESTCQQLRQVYFTDSLYELPLNTSTEELNKKIDWYAYPFNGVKTKEVDGIEIVSSNENVIKVIPGNGAPSLELKGVGVSTLTAFIKVDQQLYKSDSCQVNVYLPDNQSNIINSNVDPKSCYYPLRKNIKNLSNINSQYAKNKLSFSLDILEDNAELIDGEILFIKNPNKDINITVQYTIVGSDIPKTETFTVNNSVATPKLIELADTLVIPVGQITKINGWTPIFEGKSYIDKFQYSNENFIAKYGQDIPEFEVKDINGNKKNIHLIITEDPLYIFANIDTLHTTNEAEVNFTNTVAPSIFPTTSRKADGSRYILKTTYYDPIESGVATFENDTITFNGPGSANGLVTCKIDNETYWQEIYTICSTYYTRIGKFQVLDADNKVVHPYDKKTLNPRETLSLYIPREYVSWAASSDLKVKSHNNLCNTEITWEGGALLGNAKINITAQQKVYGTDIIEISSPVFSTYIYVDISPYVSDIIVTRAGIELDEQKPNKTYTNKLMIKAQASPCTALNQTLQAEFDNGVGKQTITQSSDGTFDLSKLTWTENAINTLVVKATDAGEQSFTKEIKFNYSKESPKFELEDCSEGFVYLTANATQKVCKVTTDGFVDDDWFKNIEADTESHELGEKVMPGKYITISNVALPEAEDYKPYSNNLNIQIKEQPETRKTYKMGRDFVSQISFPGHDNNDMTDKKGLQKVHVYGNHSFYKEDMKEVDYYKLPVELYDNKHNLIKNTPKYPEAVLTVLKTLKASFGNSNSTYKYTNDGYIEIHFHKDDLYTFDELYDNKFDTKSQNKNVTFTLSTLSNDAKAKYTFVATEGINQYCQEGLSYTSSKEPTYQYSSVLQTNFGLAQGTKNNTPLDTTGTQLLTNVYGNGYVLNYDEVTKLLKKQSARLWLEVPRALNVTLKGCNKETFQIEGCWSEIRPTTWTKGAYSLPAKFRYSNLMGFTDGIFTDLNSNGVYIKDCLLRENKKDVFYQEGNNANDLYLEDSILFDTAGIPLLGMKSKIYIKGFMDVYNFHGKEILKNIPGVGDLSELWPIIENIGRQKDMINRGADGKGYINTFGAVALYSFYFYNQITGKYEISETGLPGSSEHLMKFANVGIPGTQYNAAFWATPNGETHSGAPKYSDEFDLDGNKRLDFLYNQLTKITREIKYF